MALLEISALGLRRDGRELLREVDLQVDAGEVLAVLGPNGAGKSSLLRVAAGEWAASSGRANLAGRPMHDWSPEALARRRAVLPQNESLRFGFRVEEVVAFGRLPWSARTGGIDDGIVDAAMDLTGVAELRERLYPTLSGGERARVQFARVAAQIWDAGEDRLLLLDEPTASLDLAHQHHILAAVQKLAARRVAVIVVLHDLNLALHYADRVALMRQGRIHVIGPAAQVLVPRHIRDVYGVEVEHLPLSDDPRGWLATRCPPPTEHN